ncbi:fluoride efflux transporter CrcB [Allomuricauda sp. SCSIO 65647]|uniref:fluoride efflux transporter CrcB n=1 Tax=Allomuricauda sp. SCSIO 65647 TaxID=2908843 RepID=UPI001F1CBC91|nr:fluoride efflux transporter CrcB [Muricauda sp. SCSIO 65647]UJH66770.1 fluoride efflux transporter CrcB [Muricauda sp. SCSIO 65647]
MKQLLLVFLGGGIGSALRYLISKFLNPLHDSFYWGTFSVNIVGCLIIGIVLGLSAKENFLSQNQMLLLATGFCGGFTTFSAFALEKHTLLKGGDFLSLFVYAACSILFGILAVGFGLWLTRNHL